MILHLKEIFYKLVLLFIFSMSYEAFATFQEDLSQEEIGRTAQTAEISTPNQCITHIDEVWKTAVSLETTDFT